MSEFDALYNKLCEANQYIVKLEDQQRKRQPSEKPGDGEVVLVKLKDFGFRVCELEKFTKRPWVEYMTAFRYRIKDVEWWVPIKHLLEGE